ncbi:hypothetical protein [Chondromyces crocatus]|nr:hypothetical protein [Chondromyces crocatus]
MRGVFVAFSLALGGLLSASGCDRHSTLSLSVADPKGEDLVKGAVVAASESSGGIRLYKIVHVDDYPPPLDYEIHMIAYEPKAQTFEDAAALWSRRERLTIASDHVYVQRSQFLLRERHVLRVEPVTDQEAEGYARSKH